MINKDGYIVCDKTKIILNDGVTLWPGYVEVKEGHLYRYDSADPENERARFKKWILHNRVEFKFTAEEEPCINPKLQGKHFISKVALEKYLESLDK